MIKVELQGGEMEAPNDTSVIFPAGIDALEHIKRGERILIEAKVIMNASGKMILLPVGLAHPEEWK